MPTPVPRQSRPAPNDGSESDIPMLLERVCAKLPHAYTRRLVRDVVRLKLELGFEGDVREYLQRRSGEFPTVDPEPAEAAEIPEPPDAA